MNDHRRHQLNTVELSNSDLINVEEALEQMSFRCIRNIHILNDLIALNESPEARNEKLFVSEKLRQYRITKEKVKALQNAKS